MMSPMHVPRDSCQAMRPPPLSILAPRTPSHLCPESSCSPVPSSPPPPSLASASCRWETLAWSFVRGRGKGVSWWKDFAPLLGLEDPGSLFLRLAWKNFPSKPSSPWKEPPSSLYFSTCCIAKCPIAPAPF